MNLRTQRIIGAALVLLSWALLFLTAAGTSPQERDATAALLALPLGLYLIFTEDNCLP